MKKPEKKRSKPNEPISVNPVHKRFAERGTGGFFSDMVKSDNDAVWAEGPEMVVISAGQYVRGSPATEVGHQESEGLQIEVTIEKPFAIGVTPITVAQYKVYLERRTRFPSRPIEEWACFQQVPREQLEGEPREAFLSHPYRYVPLREHFETDLCHMPARRFQRPDTLPVHYVNWFDAQGYAAWLSERTGYRYRLPSEAEWEYMARAGTTTPYYSGNLPPGHGDRFRREHWTYRGEMSGKKRYCGPPMKCFAPNPWGVYHDSATSEWCEDVWHDSYAGAPADGSAWTEGDDPRRRVLRSWGRSAFRKHDVRGYRAACHGFRIVRDC